jgi:HAD superfamily hydrolase (TIGR01490 family)
VAAFFDLDRTLVACNPGRLFMGDLYRRGQISIAKAVRALGWLAKYHLSIVDLETVVGRVGEFLKGRSEQEFAEQCQRWVEDEVLPLLLPAGLKKIDAHRSEGHVVALLSSTPSYVAQPLARTLNLDAAGATHFEVKAGVFTGALMGPACFGHGKIHWAERVGRDHDLDVRASWFYTDSYTDMPMLERVRNPVVVNPDPRLKRAARARGWQTEDWVDNRSSS